MPVSKDKEIDDAGKGLFVACIQALTDFLSGKASFEIDTTPIGNGTVNGVTSIRRSIRFKRDPT